MHILPESLSTHQDYKWYWENLASSSKIIQHDPSSSATARFFTDPDMLKGRSANGVVLLLTRFPTTNTGDSDYTHEIKRFSVMILKAVGHEDQEKLDEAITLCEQAYREIVGKLQFDSDPINKQPPYFSYFRLNDITYDVIDDPILSDGWVGVDASIPMGNPQRFYHDTNNWQ